MSELNAMHDRVEDIWASSLDHIHVDIIQRYMDEQAADLAAQTSINESLELVNETLNRQLKESKVELDEAQKNAAFYRCCALSGEIPTEGSGPFPTSEVKG
jgi:hypothetical protein